MAAMTAFLSPSVLSLPLRPLPHSSRCSRRPPRAQASKPPANDPLPSKPPSNDPLPSKPPLNDPLPEITNTPVSRKKLVRSDPGVSVEPLSPAASSSDELFAEAYPGEAGGVEVGTGLGPKLSGNTGAGQKRVTKASEAQGSMSFADAWASQNRDRGGGRVDVWFVIGLLFILTPPVIIGVAIYTGAIPGFRL